MRRRAVWTILAAAAAIAATVGVWSASSVEPARLPDDVVAVGSYSQSVPIVIGNRSIPDGEWLVGYSMRVLFTPADASTTLRCGLEDTSGRLGFFSTGDATVTAGSWQTLTFVDRLDLTELTLGLRCRPSASGLLTAVFRDARIVIEPTE